MPHKRDRQERVQVIVIDNFDSFTYNLVDEFEKRGCDTLVFRNLVTVEMVNEALQKSNCKKQMLLFSPGPGKPSQAGNMPKMLDKFAGQLPIVGICLGHQAIVEHYGGKIGAANNIVHGKASNLKECSHPIFSGLPRPIRIARYHSLAARKIPAQLEVIAEAEDEVMAVIHNEQKVIGLQFHPESILSTYGGKILENCIHYFFDGH